MKRRQLWQRSRNSSDNAPRTAQGKTRHFKPKKEFLNTTETKPMTCGVTQHEKMTFDWKEDDMNDVL